MSEEFKLIQKQKQSLSSLAEQLQDIAVSLGNPPWARRIENIRTRLESDRFRVMVVGEFKRGKSTFINAMLGESILPAYAIPCTAAIHEIRYGNEKRAYVYPATNNGDGPLEPEEVPIEKVCGNGGSFKKFGEGLGTINPENPDSPSEYDKIVLHWPLSLLENGVDIIDSPGLNEHGNRTRTTMDFLPRADAIIFVMACDQFGAKVELSLLDDVLKPMGYKDIFFVCNRINLIPEIQQKDLKDWARDKLAERDGNNGRWIFFIDALGALQGREKGDENQIEASGIKALETDLENFLAREKGQVKLFTISAGLRELIRQARGSITANEALARTSEKDLVRRVKNARDPYKILKRKTPADHWQPEKTADWM